MRERSATFWYPDRVRGLFAGIALAATACTLLTPIDGDLTSGAATGDAGNATAADASANDASAANDASDATAEAGPVACTRGARVGAVRAFDASPEPGYVCALDDAVVEDGKVAGIDRGPNEALLDGHGVTGCLGVELASPVDQVTIRAQPTAQGCLTACGSNCGSGDQFSVFAGVTEKALAYVAGVDMTATGLTDYAVPLGGAFPDARFVAVCRTPNGDSRDDVAVDVVYGRCR